MGLTGVKKKAPGKAGGRQGRSKDLTLILDQLDREFDAYSQHCVSADSAPSVEEQGLMAYFFCCVRVALHWVGDPYTVEFPEHYQGERLAKLCRWLSGLQPEQLEQARAGQVAQLHRRWPAYAAKCTTYRGDDGSPPDVLGFTWVGLDSLWSSDEPTDDTRYFPKFGCVESEDFHLLALAVLFLNRATRRKLSDLEA
jgi:hypothetical protein